MDEKVHNVTWYSKALSIAAVGVVAVSGFWMGQAFQAEEQEALTASALYSLRPVSERMIEIPETDPELQLQEVLAALEVENSDVESILEIIFKTEEVSDEIETEDTTEVSEVESQ